MKATRAIRRTIVGLLTATLAIAIACSDSETSTPSPSAAEDDSLVLASGRNLGTGNPHDYSSSFVLLDLLYEPLVRYDAAGEIQPALAESFDISNDGLTWTFQLRSGVTFHDGTPFDAEAAKWNLERWIGVEDHGWLPTSTRVSSIETQGQSTIVLTLSHPYYPAIQDLTLVRPVRFLSSASVDSAGDFVDPVGTGPWMVESLSDTRAVLVRNEDYWGEKPALEEVVIEVILDGQTRIAALLSGEVDAIGGSYLGGISLESLTVLERNDDVRLLDADGIVSFYASSQADRAPLDDVRVRRALNHAIDRAGISSALFAGRAEPAQHLLPANIPYVTASDADRYEHDPDRAKALLTEAGWTLNGNGLFEKDGATLKLTLVVDEGSSPQSASMAEAMQAQLKEAGIELDIRAFDYSGWLNALYANDYDLIMRSSWGPPYDPHTLLSGVFYTDTDEENTVSYSDAALDQLIDSALAATDPEERQEFYTQIWERLNEQAVVVPLVFPQRVVAVRDEVEGFRLGGSEYDWAFAVQEVTIAAN